MPYVNIKITKKDKVTKKQIFARKSEENYETI